MQEVKEICDRMLAEPAPPMTTPDDLLDHARRDRAKHRTTVGIGLATAATLFVAAAVPLLMPTHSPPGAAIVAGPSPQVSSPSPVELSSVVPEEDLNTIILRLVGQTNSANYVFYLRSAGRVPAPADDLCQAELPARFSLKGTAGPCEVVTVKGINIRTGSFQITQSPGTTHDILFALRYEGEKVYMALQTPSLRWDDPKASGPPTLTRQQLAEMLASLNFS